MIDKSKLNKKDFIFRKIENQTLERAPGSINGIDFNCRFLKNCTVYLCDYMSTIYVDDCENCTFYLGPVLTSIFMRDCKNCSISVAAGQIRISNSQDIKLFAFCKSDPTLEKVQGIRIGPYNLRYPKVGEHFQTAGFDPTEDRWNQVVDFSKKEVASDFSILDPSDWPGVHLKEFDGIEGDSALPTRLPSAYGGEYDVDIYERQDLETHSGPGGIQNFAIGTDEDFALGQQEISSSITSQPVTEQQTQDIDSYFGFSDNQPELTPYTKDTQQKSENNMFESF